MTEDHIDILIIGAGVAGLAAARLLAHTGLRIQVLEARNRIGGRIFTCHDPTLSMPVDLGAEFIHGTPAEIWQIINAARLPVHEINGESWWSHQGSLHSAQDLWLKVDQILRQIPQAAQRDCSFQDFLASLHLDDDEWDEAKMLATAFVEGFNAARSDRISIQALGGDEEAGGQFRLLGGYDGVVNWLHAGLDPAGTVVRYNTVVTRIAWSEGAVEVHAQGPTGRELAPLRATCAIITLPLGVLQAPPEQPGGVRFLPDLVEKRAAAQRLEMGPVIKITLRFRQRFWENSHYIHVGDGEGIRDLSFIHTRAAAFPTWWTAYPILMPLLTGWAGGTAATRLTGQSELALVDQAVEAVAQAFGVRRAWIEGLLDAWYTHDWQADPFARGAYSYLAVGGLDVPAILAQPIADTLFFAGEATNTTGHEATVHGAIATGRRAAHEVLQRFTQPSGTDNRSKAIDKGRHNP